MYSTPNPQFSEQICFVIWGDPFIIIIPDLINFSGFTSDLINHLWRRQWLSITIVFNLSPPLHQHPSAQHKRFKSITMFPSKRNISHNNYNFKRFECFRQNEMFPTKKLFQKIYINNKVSVKTKNFPQKYNFKRFK